MLQVPPEWITHFGANLVTCYPPELGARIRYFERLVPQPSFAAIVGRTLAGDAFFRATQVGEMQRVVTSEGEYGAVVTIEGLREGARAMRYVGAVFVDEFASALDAIALVPQHFAAVEHTVFDVVRGIQHDLTRRPRRFFYVPPPGWHGLPSGPIANWYPLDFPRNLTNLVVPPALAVDDGPRELETAIAQCSAGLAIETTARDELTSAGGVRGTHLRLCGKRAGRAELIYRDLIAFVTGGHLYRMRLETTNATELVALRELFRAVACSFRPLPSAEERRTGRAFATPSTAFEHWVS